MYRSLPEKPPARRGICAFMRRKWQAFKGAERNEVAKPLPEVDLTGPTKVPLECMYDLHVMKLREGFFVATRRSDGQEVSVNVVPRRPKYNIACPGFWWLLEKKVALNVLLSGRERSQHIQQLHRWFEEEEKVFLVYDNPSMSLDKYVKKSGGRLREAEARGLFKQAAEGVKHSLDHGVFHHQVFDRKFILDESTNRVKLQLYGDEKRITSVYEIRQFKGQAFDLQNLEIDRFNAELTTVWYLGKLAYKMIHGHEPYKTKKGNELNLDSSLSRECFDFLNKCLQKNPLHRISLEEMMAHKWITGVEEGPSDPDVHEPDVSERVTRPFHLGHTSEVEFPGPTTGHLKSSNP